MAKVAAKAESKRTAEMHAQGLEALNLWIPRDLKRRIDAAAKDQARDLRVVVTRALEAAFPKAIRLGSSQALDAAERS